jgi:predicted MFS family arabinose efflux permease
MKSVSARHVTIVCALATLAEALFFSAIAPLLPALDHELGLGHITAGVLVATYGIGYALGTYPALRLASSVGPRATAVIGMLCIAAGTLSFALSSNIVGLFAGRMLAGFGSVAFYTGAIALAEACAAADSGGATIGTVYSGTYAGSAVGPLIGSAAEALGRSPVFSLLAGAQLATSGLMTLLPSVPAKPESHVREVFGYLRDGRVRLGLWITSLPAFGIGILLVSGSFRIDEVGGSSLLIAAAFAGMAVINTVSAPPLGRITDKRGRLGPLCVLMVLAAVTLAILIPLEARLPVTVLIAISGSLITLLGGPGFALIVDAVDLRGGNAAEATFLMNLFWGPSAALGAILAGIFHGAVGAWLSFAVLSAVAAASAGIVYRQIRVLRVRS